MGTGAGGNERPGVHANCVVCSTSNEKGLGLDFTVLPDGSVEAGFDCARVFEGYDNVLHGGIIATLLDGAMTNCMFAHGVHAVTAELNVRFLCPVECNRQALVRAWITRPASRLYLLAADLSQNGTVMATGTGKFIRLEEPEDFDGAEGHG
jgi:uncharacterized protein (TIGR00369 family)